MPKTESDVQTRDDKHTAKYIFIYILKHICFRGHNQDFVYLVKNQVQNTHSGFESKQSKKRLYAKYTCLNADNISVLNLMDTSVSEVHWCSPAALCTRPT